MALPNQGNFLTSGGLAAYGNLGSQSSTQTATMYVAQVQWLNAQVDMLRLLSQGFNGWGPFEDPVLETTPFTTKPEVPF